MIAIIIIGITIVVIAHNLQLISVIFLDVLSHHHLLFYVVILQLQSWTKGCRQIHEIKQNRFLYGMFYGRCFAIFYRKTSKFVLKVAGWVIAIKLKHFNNILEISQFPKILSIKSFGNT